MQEQKDMVNRNEYILVSYMYATFFPFFSEKLLMQNANWTKPDFLILTRVAYKTFWKICVWEKLEKT